MSHTTRNMDLYILYLKLKKVESRSNSIVNYNPAIGTALAESLVVFFIDQSVQDIYRFSAKNKERVVLVKSLNINYSYKNRLHPIDAHNRNVFLPSFILKKKP